MNWSGRERIRLSCALGDLEVWFAVRPGPREERRDPYVGTP